LSTGAVYQELPGIFSVDVLGGFSTVAGFFSGFGLAALAVFFFRFCIMFLGAIRACTPIFPEL